MAKQYTRKNIDVKQLLMLDLIHEHVYIGGNHALYVETGKYKPWSPRTHQALERKGLVTVSSTMAGVFHVTPTDLGTKVAKSLHEAKYGVTKPLVTTIEDSVNTFSANGKFMVKNHMDIIRTIGDSMVGTLNNEVEGFMNKLKETYPDYNYSFICTVGAIIKVFPLDTLDNAKELCSMSQYTPSSTDMGIAPEMVEIIVDYLIELNRIREQYSNIGFNTALGSILVS